MIRLESICLDLGEIGEPEFYREFPKRLAEKLDDFFADCLKFRGKYPMEVIPVFTDKTKALLFFLLYGFFVQGTPVEFRGLAVLLKEVVENNGARFIHFLKEYGNVPSIRERLVFQFSDGRAGNYREGGRAFGSGVHSGVCSLSDCVARQVGAS